MLRVVAHKSAAAALQYYAEGLKREDYYSEGQEVVGKWHGCAAELLGLSGKVTPDAFAALVYNRHPGTGERLTPRTKTDRVVGYDLNFHAPKSLSVLHALTGDDDILKAFRGAVVETMGEIEGQVATRVRKRGAQENRVTGNLAWAEFMHFTTRPVGGIPDPHLHIHCFTFNATFDSEESRWKAAKFRQIKQDAPYSQAAFHARLTAKLAGLGYGIRRTKDGWDIEGIPRTIIDRFSRRTAQIEQLAHDMGITDAKAKDGLGAASREGKRHGMTYSDLLAAWGVRLNSDEKVLISKVRYDRALQAPREKITAAAAVDYACEKMFAKDSVVMQNRLVAEALRYGVGQVKPEQVWRELAHREMVVRKVGDEILCTSLDVLAEEVSLISFVRSGRGMCAPLKAGVTRIGDDKLSSEQKAALRHALHTTDQVIAIRGVAGVGKTRLMKEVAAQIEGTGVRVFAFAQSADASRATLREEGFAGANTVAHFLLNKNLQKQARGNVIWIDEAGLLGAREMWEVMQAAGPTTRIILTGDSGQHAPVARGDAFRLLQHYAGLKIAEVTEIRRQQDETYKSAVAALSRGDMQNAFHHLDELGAIVEIPDEGERYRLLAQDFMDLSRKGSPPLVVSPTHAESAKVTAAIRDAKREAGQLKGERDFVRYQNLQWENADKKRGENYSAGLLVQFHQNAKGIRRGEMFRIAGHDEKGAVRAVAASGKEISLPLKDAARFQVFEEREIKLGRGDQIRITRGSESADGRRLNNGNTFTIEKFNKNGGMVLNNGAVLDSKHGHFTHGYCQTSHSSQSKSVRDVLVAQSADSFVASSREQFYVSVSRGKESIRIYTDDRRGLQEAVGNTSTRKSALEVAGITKRDLSAMNSDASNKVWRDVVRSRKAEGDFRVHVKSLLKSRRQDEPKKEQGFSWKKYVEMRRGLVGPDGKSRSKGHGGNPKSKGGSMDGKRRSFLRPTELTAPVTERMKAAHEAKKNGAEAKQPVHPRRERLAKAYQSAAAHFKEVTGRHKSEQFGKLEAPKAKGQETVPAKQQPAKTHGKNQETMKSQARGEQGKVAAQQVQNAAQQQAKQGNKPLPQSNMTQAVNHSAKQRAVDAGKAAGEAAKMAKQAQAAKVKPPAPPPPTPRK